MNEKEKFIAELYPAARHVAQETGMSWELILAQAAQETGWGQKVLEGSNNIFNIKDSPGWNGQTKTYKVWEIDANGNKVWQDDKFRVYGNNEEALRDRVKFLEENPRYGKAGLFDEGVKGNFEAEAKALQKAGYATDPKYAEQLVDVFNGRTMKNAIAYGQALERGETLPELGAGQEHSTTRNPMSDGMLVQGEKGEAVHAMQGKLAGLGFTGVDGKPLKPDSDFGKSTRHAVEEFQRQHGLDVDGKAGKDTLTALDAAAKAQGQAVAAPAQPATEPLAVAKAPSLTDATHPDHARFGRVTGQLEGLESQRAQAGLSPLFANRQELENAAGQVTFESKVSGMKQIDMIVARPDGAGVFAVQGGLSDPAAQRVYVDRAQAVGQSVEASTQQLNDLNRQFGAEQAQPGQTQTQGPTR